MVVVFFTPGIPGTQYLVCSKPDCYGVAEIQMANIIEQNRALLSDSTSLYPDMHKVSGCLSAI